MSINISSIERNRFVLAGILLGSLLANDPVTADDIEIYTAALDGGFEDQIRPNILYVVDTSGSMTRPPGFFIDPKEYWDGAYDPNTIYPGPCDPNLVYRKSVDEDANGNQYLNAYGYPIEEPGDPLNPTGEEEANFNFQSCDNEYFFPLVDLVCDRALEAFNDPERGWYADHWAEQTGVQSDGDLDWHGLSSSDNSTHGWRECAGDYGVHGENDTSTTLYPAENTTGWTSSVADSDIYDNILGNSAYVVAPGNYLNWIYAAGQDRITAVKIALREIIQGLPDETNVGLMRFDTGSDKSNTEGGMMFHGFVEVGSGANRESLVNTLMNLDNRTDGGTPLAETMLEAAYVFIGGPVYFGGISADADGSPMPSVPGSRQDPTPGTEGYKYYRSPIEYSCQQNAVVYLTDGAATSDYSADSYYAAYDGEVNAEDPWNRDEKYWAGGGYVEFRGGLNFFPNATSYLEDEDGDGDVDACDSATLNCLPKITEWLANEDVNPDVAGVQHVYTNTIGFIPADAEDGQDTLPDPEFLQEAADRGKGQFFQVTSFDELKEAFQVLTRKAVSSNTAFTAPAVAVNAFNRTQDENIVLLAVFKSETTPGWGGNLKAYQFGTGDDGEVELQDAAGNAAVDPDTGNFYFDARSIWSAVADGNEAVEGGAASNLPATRTLYTWLESTALPASLVNPAAAFIPTNSNFTDAMFGMDGTESYDRADVIKWMSGVDVLDQDGDGETTDRRHHMGDPLHSRPVIVTYGPSEDDRQQKAFLTTNDGFLHIIDMETGQEVFGFVALETLGNAKRMFEADASKGKAYGLDGAPVLWIDEGPIFSPGINQDGETDDTVRLYVGMRRGGRSYYAFDVTDPSSPTLLWRIEGGDLDDDGVEDTNETFYYLGQSWSTPQRGQVRINNQVRDILVFGGGYDTIQDDPDEDPGTTSDGYVEDRYGNAVYIVDAKTGDRLWWASSETGADLVIADMKNAIPSDIALVDADADGWSDRIYVGDMGGRVFRIDLSEISATSLSGTGGMIADLGASAVTDDTSTIVDEAVQASRKFFYPPDVVVVENGSSDYIALALGSGARNHPSYPVMGDTAVQDAFFVLRDPNILNRPADNDYDYGLTLDSLHDATTDDDVPGDTEGWYIRMTREGEKVLAGSITFNYQTLFTSFEPQELDLATCQARTGIGRAYAIDLRTSKAVSPAFYVDEASGETGSELTIEDRSYELARDGIPPAPTIAFPEANNGKSLPMAGTEKLPLDTGTNRHKAYWYIKED